MATKPITSTFAKFTFEIEDDDTPGTWIKVCGITSREVNREHNITETEVPSDCDDEDAPSAIEIDVKSSQVSASLTGVWTQQGHELLMDWWYGKQLKNCRIGHLNAAVGDTEYETGPARLINMPDSVERGQKVQRGALNIRFDGLPTRTAKVAGP